MTHPQRDNAVSRRTRSAVNWDWRTETWDWSPEQGRWLPDHGRPEGCVHLRVDTEALRPQDAYDFWCETVFCYFEPDSASEQQRQRFSASLDGLISPRGEFYLYQSDALSGRRSERQCRRDPGGDIDIGMLIRGQRTQQQQGDRVMPTGPGEMTFFDSMRPAQVAWQAHAGLHLSLAAEQVREVFGEDRPLPSVAANAILRSPMSPFLKAQLQLLARHAGDMDDIQRAMVLDSSIDLALTVLRSALTGTLDADQSAGGLFAAACRMIDLQLGNPALDATFIAQRLGCSRATLYRVFAAQNEAVAAYIRERRLQRVWVLLHSQPANVSIAEIARRCGFLDSTSFSRLFRRRFGERARDVRARR